MYNCACSLHSQLYAPNILPPIAQLGRCYNAFC